MPLLEDNSSREQAQPNDFSPEVVKCLDDLIDLLIDLKLLDKKQVIKLPEESNSTSELNIHEGVELSGEPELTSKLNIHEGVELSGEPELTSKLNSHEGVELSEESNSTSELNTHEVVELSGESDLTSKPDTLESIVPVKALEDLHEPSSQTKKIILFTSVNYQSAKKANQGRAKSY